MRQRNICRVWSPAPCARTPISDFKQERYANSDPARRDLAGDVAAMANTRGGLIVIGIRDENDVAVELTLVPLEKEARTRQIAVSNIAPISPSTFGSCTATPTTLTATTY